VRARVRAYLHATFSSLGTRNYRLYFAGQSISVMGTWMQKVSQAWLVLELTDSGIVLGLTTAIQQLPSLLLTPWGGLLADRADKRKILLCTQALAILPALCLGTLTATHSVRIWIVLVLALALGCIEAMDKPTRHTFVVEMVGRDHLTNAVALNNIVQNAGKVVGPAVAGILITTLGLPWAFFINAASFLTVIVGLLRMDTSKLSRPVPAPPRRGQLREGLGYVRGRPHLLGPLVLMAVTGTLGYNFNVVIPLLGKQTFGGDASTVGYMYTAMGLGAIVGAFALASTLKATVGRLLLGGMGFAVVLTATGLAPTLLITLGLLFVLGSSSVSFRSVATSLLQLNSAPAMRGRVVSLLVVAIGGTTPIGGPLVGWIGEEWSARVAFVIGGVSTALAVLGTRLYLARRSAVSPVSTMDGPGSAGGDERAPLRGQLDEDLLPDRDGDIGVGAHPQDGRADPQFVLGDLAEEAPGDDLGLPHVGAAALVLGDDLQVLGPDAHRHVVGDGKG
jgi:MFS family permease